MKILVFGNLASGKSSLSNRLNARFPIFERVCIDNFRLQYGDGTLEKEKLAKRLFLSAIRPQKPQIIEATGVGETGEALRAKLATLTRETKIVILLQTPLTVCLERLKLRIAQGAVVPYPAPPQEMISLAQVTQNILDSQAFRQSWLHNVEMQWVELPLFTEEALAPILAIIQKEVKKII
jgi:adenylate kinase family enzyme